MELSQVVQQLQNQFGGQTVLYAKDLAVILGKTERAIEQLIGRDRLPFPIKPIGGRRCASIFQVAQWLIEDVLPTEVPEDFGRGQTKPIQPVRSSKRPARSSMASKLMTMRQESALNLRRFASDKLIEKDEQLFVLEIAEQLLFAPGSPEATYVVVCSRLDFEGSATVHDDRKFFLENYAEVRQVLERIQNEWGSSESAKIVVKRKRRRIFNAYHLEGFAGWIVEKDEQWWGQ